MPSCTHAYSESKFPNIHSMGPPLVSAEFLHFLLILTGFLQDSSTEMNGDCTATALDGVCLHDIGLRVMMEEYI